MRIFVIILYLFYLFSILYTLDTISVLELLDKSYGVNIHTYYLMGLALFVFIFSLFDGSTSSPALRIFFLLNLLLNIFIFKTRGTLPVNFILCYFSLFQNFGIFKVLFKSTVVSKISLIISIFIIYFFLFSIQENIADLQNSEGRIEDFSGVLGKELSGKRDIILREW